MNIRKKVLKEEHPDYAVSLVNLAGLYQTMYNYTASEPLYTRALAIFRKAFGEKHPYYASALNNLGILYKSSGNYKSAKVYYKQAIAIRKKALGKEHPDYAQSLSNMALLYVTTNNYKEAKSLYNEQMSISKKVLGEAHSDYAICLNNFANLYKAVGDYSVAEPMYRQALGVYKKATGEGNAVFAGILFNLATLYESMGRYVEAANLFTKSAHLSFNHIESNFTILSEAEKLKWWENARGNFHAAPSLLLTDQQASPRFVQETFAQQQRLKAFVLNNGARIFQEARRNGNPDLRTLLSRWQTNKATLAVQYSLRIAERMDQLDSLEKVTNDQEKEINRQSAVLLATKQNQRIDLNNIRQQLKEDEAAIEFIRFEYYHRIWTDSNFYAAFIVLPKDTTPHFVILCEEKQLAALLDSNINSTEEHVNQLYRGVIVSNSKAANGKRGDSLYHLIWKPLVPWLADVKKISFAPSGLLNRIAFAALAIDDSTYLIDKYQLRQYSSIGQIADKNIPLSDTIITTDVVLYGGIEFNFDTISSLKTQTVSNLLPDNIKSDIRGENWNPLPGTLQEVNSISRLFKTNKKNIRVITGAEASEESLKKLDGNSPVILHLATHGFSLPGIEQNEKYNLNNRGNQFTLAGNPLLRSGIIMSGANRVWGGASPVAGIEDGIVTAYEISNLDLSKTDLVVLSACETALGDIKGTEGVFGLQRAFKMAGVKNMILSLWQVPDKETEILMSLFYTNKLQGMTTYESFNKAQNIMRRTYPPYYWAAFMLIE